VPAST